MKVIEIVKKKTKTEDDNSSIFNNSSNFNKSIDNFEKINNMINKNKKRENDGQLNRSKDYIMNKFKVVIASNIALLPPINRFKKYFLGVLVMKLMKKRNLNKIKKK